MSTAEHQRLSDSEERLADWKNWGPYVSDRAWGTVREDYSKEGSAWEYFDFWQANKRAYRWNEDGIAGFCNRLQNLCLGVSLWNEKDPILKERFFGVSGNQGNHGEDVKEYYFYLDSTPTHSYAKMLYKYPISQYPYEELISENQRRDKNSPEYELYDALQEDFDTGKYFDVFIEYAKGQEEDILCRITAVNRSNEDAPLHILPHIWYRNTWSWEEGRSKPIFEEDNGSVKGNHKHLKDVYWYVNTSKVDDGNGNLLFTENETNFEELFGSSNNSPYVKDGINNYVVNGNQKSVNPEKKGTKVASHFKFNVPSKKSVIVETRFVKNNSLKDPFNDFNSIMEQRVKEADEFYNTIHSPGMNEDEKNIQRQALGGLMWNKQFYHFGITLWKEGDPAFPKPPPERKHGRNSDWDHLYTLDVISMPDKWEYPWFATWDLAFHTLAIAMIDPEWAKRQLILMTREWYMHPNGQLPAYEWAFDDVNPPVHAWACWRVYQITKDPNSEKGDLEFLEKVFQKLLLNFTWWVNRKDSEGNNVFQGGFLGLDNIGVFDRSSKLKDGVRLDQADGTAWMANFALTMLTIALEIAKYHKSYEDVATKFFEHFVIIANSINEPCSAGGLWCDKDGFYYDSLHYDDGHRSPVRLQSLVGLIPLFAVTTIDPKIMDILPHFKRRTEWFIKYRPHLVKHLNFKKECGGDGTWILSIANPERLKRLATKLFDSSQFLSAFGIRSLSKIYGEHPFSIFYDGEPHEVSYQPAESNTYLFGGNSNWRGPIWMPTNYMMVECLQIYGHHYGEDIKVEYPVGSHNFITFSQAAEDLSQRLSNLFLLGREGTRPVNGGVLLFSRDMHWQDYILFYEYFHGDNGAGIGASHQTGWTSLIARLLIKEPVIESKTA